MMPIFTKFRGPQKKVLTAIASIVCCVFFGPIVLSVSASAGEWDKRVQRGVLDNGLSYYLYDSGKADDPFNVRLIVHAGAVDEVQPTGLAHMLEHMVFQSTRSHPETVHRYIQQLGWRTGVQINALTRDTETQYMIRTRPDDALDIDGSVALAADLAFGARLLDRQWQNERNVILEELRLGDKVAARINRQKKDLLRNGSRYAGRSTIGTEATIKSTDISQIRQFYERFYVASNMTLVVSGRIDVTRTRQAINRYFGQAPAKPRPERNYLELPLKDATKVGLVQDSQGTTSQVSIALRVAMPQRSTQKGRRAYLQKYLLTRLVRDRLREVTEIEYTGFDTVSFVSQEPTNQRVIYAFNIRSGDHQKAVDMIFQVMERIRREGISEQAFSKAVQAALRANRGNVKAARTRNFAEWEDMMTSAVLTQGALEDPAAKAQVIERILKDLTLEEINLLLDEILSSDDIVVYFQVPGGLKASLPTIEHVQASRSELRAALMPPQWPRKTAKQNVADQPLPVWPKDANVASGGKLLSENQDPKRHITEWSLSNGDKVIWLARQTDDNNIYISGQSEPGFNNEKYSSLTSQASIQLWTQSGYKFWTQADYDRWYTAQKRKWDFTLHANTFNAGIVVDKQGLQSAFDQYASTIAYGHIRKEAAESFERQMGLKPANTDRSYADLLYGHNSTGAYRSETTDVTMMEETARSLFAQPVKWFVVGPAPDKQTREDFVRTLGATGRENRLKAQPLLQKVGSRKSVIHTMDTDRAEVKISFYVDMEWKPETAFIFSTLTPILQQAIKNELRLKRGGIYTSSLELNLDPQTNRATGTVSFVCAADRAEELTQATLDVIKNAPDHIEPVNVNGIREDMIFAERTRLSSTSTWLRRLQLSYRRYGDGRYLDNMLGLPESIDKELLRSEARRIASSENVAVLIRLPRSAAYKSDH